MREDPKPKTDATPAREGKARTNPPTAKRTEVDPPRHELGDQSARQGRTAGLDAQHDRDPEEPDDMQGESDVPERGPHHDPMPAASGKEQRSGSTKEDKKNRERKVGPGQEPARKGTGAARDSKSTNDPKPNRPQAGTFGGS